jgi:hypothetical protein
MVVKVIGWFCGLLWYASFLYCKVLMGVLEKKSFAYALRIINLYQYIHHAYRQYQHNQSKDTKMIHYSLFSIH